MNEFDFHNSIHFSIFVKSKKQRKNLFIYKKIKSSTNYWVVVSPIILTLIQQVFAILYGEAIVNYGIVKLEDTNFNDFWEFIIYIFDIYKFIFFLFRQK